MSNDSLSKLSVADRELLFSSRWLASEIKRIAKGQGCPPSLANYADDILDNLTEVLDVELPSHFDKDLTPSEKKPTLDEETLDGTKSDAVPGKAIGRLYVAPGHNDGTGATSFDGLDEWRTSKLVAEAMKRLGPEYGLEVMIGIRDRSKGYGDAMRLHGLKSLRFKADLAIEIHRNAFNGRAIGVETIVVSDSGSIAGRILTAASLRQYPGLIVRGDQGLRNRKAGGNGAGWCKAHKCPAILVEPCFFDNRDDWPRIRDHVEKEARTLLASARVSILNGFESKVPTLDEADVILGQHLRDGDLGGA